MEIGSAAWSRLIAEGAAAFGVRLEEAQLARFARHAVELLAWNAVTNLTAITRPEAIARNHFVDALAAAPFLRAGERLLDVGSGGGFPGLPLHVAVAGLETTLIDAVRKKVSFLRHVIRSLGLTGIEARQMRLEDLGREAGAGGVFDAVVTRAALPLATVVRLAAPLLSSGGRIIAYRGAEASEESTVVENLAAASSPPLAIATHPYVLTGLKAPRTLVIVRRRGPALSPPADR